MNDWIMAGDTTRAWAEGVVVVWSPTVRAVAYRTEDGDFVYNDGETIPDVQAFFYVHPPHFVGVDEVPN